MTDVFGIHEKVRRYREINSGLLTESRPDPHAPQKLCPVCEEQMCYGVQCVACWRREKQTLMFGDINNQEWC